MASEVDAFVENSKFEKRKSKNIKSARSLSSMLNEKQDFEEKRKKYEKRVQTTSKSFGNFRFLKRRR